MVIFHSIYSELPGTIDQVRAVLRCIDRWATLPTGAIRSGELWRWGRDLYRVVLREDAAGMEVEALPVARSGGRLHIAVRLRDAGISTHATIDMSLDAPIVQWRRGQARRMVAQRAHLCVDTLRHELEHCDNREHVRIDETTVASPDDLANALRSRYPATVAAFEAMHALDHLQRVYHLEHGWQRIAAGAFDESYHAEHAPVSSPPLIYDLLYAGGGLGLLHAVVMARNGWHVLVFDRGEVGCAHREWNISRAELAALLDLGIVTDNELQSIVMRDYRTGLVRFHSGPNAAAHNDLWLPGVLDVALDAGALLRLMRGKLEAAGGTVLDGRTFRRVVACSDSTVAVELTASATGAPEVYRGRLLLDGMGSTSPLALLRHRGDPFAAVCPTVGTVATGFVAGNDDPRHHDPTLGDILISVTDAQRGQQYMWEGFPGRDDELTVYLFYYDTTNDHQRTTKRHSLLALFEDYFALLPSYKEPGPHFAHRKPVYGYIPARHSLRRQEAPLLRGVLPVGDSAAQQSPLTFCGFGSHVRNLQRTTSLLDYALRHNLDAPRHLQGISAFQSNVSLNWVFSRFMHPWGQPASVNELQNIFLGVLNELGRELATRFFQDRMRWSDYHKMVLGMFRRYPPVVMVAWRVLGPTGCRQWIGDYLRFSGEALLAAMSRAAGSRGERLIYRFFDAIRPPVSLAVRSRYAEWRAMGWL